MIDIHNHALFALDDGSSSIEESLSILEKLYNIGFSEIVLTPHYISGSKYDADNKIKDKKIKELEKELKNKKIPIKLYKGNEIFINSEINELIKDNKIFTINDTNYILIEFSLYTMLNNIEDLLYELSIQGYKIIIAHPERYSYFQRNHKILSKFKEDNNVYFQSNYSSITGRYGLKAKRLMKYLLKNDLVDFLGTDVHRSESSVLEDFDKIKVKITKIIGEDNFNKLSDTNIKIILNNKEIKNS